MYIRSEDLGVQFIGPFPSRAAAQAHLDEHFPAYRKEQSGYKDQIVEAVEEGYSTISPAQDAAMWAEERSWTEQKKDPEGED